MTSVKRMAYHLETCMVCPRVLLHKPTGRPRKFCSGRCRTAYHRASRRWVTAYVDAIMDDYGPPPHPYPFRPRHSPQAV